MKLASIFREGRPEAALSDPPRIHEKGTFKQA
jgi:hypothetical protein